LLLIGRLFGLLGGRLLGFSALDVVSRIYGLLLRRTLRTSRRDIFLRGGGG
jgi:hypothetical protein